MGCGQWNMPLFEENTHVFIVRVWREPREIEGAISEWRGVVEHVPSKQRRYVKDLDEITTFMVSYLGQVGVRPEAGGRIRQWLNRWRLRLRT